LCRLKELKHSILEAQGRIPMVLEAVYFRAVPEVQR
jgi:hypothetical protein